MAKKKGGGFLEVVRTVVIAVLIAIGIRSFAYEPFNIPSGSMKPTLLIGDYLFVSKWSYGYSRYSLPFGLPLFSGRIFGSPPERGDVAVFKLPTDPKVDYIKRIIGLPGDQIQVRRGILYINGQAVQRQPIDDYVDENGERLKQYIETLPNGVQHRILERSDDGPLDDTDVYNVPPGHYFAMGDNRDNSQDSRVLGAVGYVPAENLVGRAEFLFFSISGGAEFWEVWKWPESIRWGRLFHTAQR
ncbi:MAG: signal peptidase I [Dongiaceae bacterium]